MFQKKVRVLLSALVFTLVINQLYADRGSYAGSGPIYHGLVSQDEYQSLTQNRFGEGDTYYDQQPTNFPFLKPMTFNNQPYYPWTYYQPNLYHQVPNYPNQVYGPQPFFGR